MSETLTELYHPQPTEVQRRPSEPRGVGGDDPRTAMRVAAQQQHQQQMHREALRLALGSILTPRSKKRPPMQPTSRSSSGTASPAFPNSFGAHSASGAHTPVGTPPVPTGSNTSGSGSYYPLAHGPNSSEYLHPHHAFGHGHPHGHPHGHGHQHQHLPPSRLGRSASSTANSPSSSAPNSSHPSPRPPAGADSSTRSLPVPMDLEPLPPAAIHSNGAIPPPSTPASHAISSHTSPFGTPGLEGSRPHIMPLQDGSMSRSASGDVVMVKDGEKSGSGTPRAKFLQTLQSKSAWDALIHGSFS